MVIRSIRSDKLSTYRTENIFSSYGEFTSLEEYVFFLNWSKENNLPLYILGNGTNTFFTRKKIKTVVLKNCLKKDFQELMKGSIRVSSSVSVLKLLKYCEKNSLDCFYFLASVPATVGGALAMNAGEGHGGTVYYFVEEITYFDNGKTLTKKKNEIELNHRRTIFSGVQDKLILSAVFRFPEVQLSESPIQQRMGWCKVHQDIYFPNCGSVFREYNGGIMKLCRKLRLPQFGVKLPMAHFSGLVNNWIINEGKNSWSILIAVRMVQLMHRFIGSRAKTEIIEID